MIGAIFLTLGRIWMDLSCWPILIVLGVKSPVLYLLGGMKMVCGAREIKLEDVELLWG